MSAYAVTSERRAKYKVGTIVAWSHDRPLRHLPRRAHGHVRREGAKAKARSNGPSGTRRSTNSLFARTGVSLVFALSTLAASFPSVWEDAIFWDDEKQRCVEYLPSLKISCVHRSLNSALLSA